MSHVVLLFRRPDVCISYTVFKRQKPNVLSSASSLVDCRLISEVAFELRSRISCPADLTETAVTRLVVRKETGKIDRLECGGV